jgi:Pvc16 N-terminal domain
VANSDVISAVSETLEARLTAGLSTLGNPPPTAQLHDLATAVTNDPPTVTLFLYQVLEDGSVRNRAKTTRIVNGTVLVRKQPLGLCLQYMVTAWGGDRHTEQRMLGRVLQVLYDDAVLDGAELAGVLAGTPASLHISLAPLELEDRARVWSAIGQTYRLSVNYEVRVADVDAELEVGGVPVRERRLGTGIAP